MSTVQQLARLSSRRADYLTDDIWSSAMLDCLYALPHARMLQSLITTRSSMLYLARSLSRAPDCLAMLTCMLDDSMLLTTCSNLVDACYYAYGWAYDHADGWTLA